MIVNILTKHFSHLEAVTRSAKDTTNQQRSDNILQPDLFVGKIGFDDFIILYFFMNLNITLAVSHLIIL